MKSGSEITTIYLERGTEDVDLLQEIHRLYNPMLSVVKFAKESPMLFKLRQILENERKKEYEGVGE